MFSLMHPLNAFFISGRVLYCISSIYFCFFHRISIFLFTLPISHCMPSTLFIKALNTLIIAVLNYQSSNSNILQYLSLVLMLILSLQTGFCLLVCFVIISWQLAIIHWVKGTAINRLSVTWGEGTFCSLMIWSQFLISCAVGWPLSPFDGTGQLEGGGVWYFHPPGQLDVDKTQQFRF